MCKRMPMSLFAVSLIQILFVSMVNAQGTADRKSPEAPSGYMLFEEENWYLLADEPGLHVQRARDAFLKADARTAAAELRKAAVHLKISASHAEDRTKRGLIRAEHELQKTAERIQAGSLKSVEEFDLAIAKAMQTLSEYQYLKAAEAWRKKEIRQAGHYLRAAADNIERAAARTEARVKTATSEVAHDTRKISHNLIEGTGYVIEDVGNGFERIGDQIERVGEKVVSSPAK